MLQLSRDNSKLKGDKISLRDMYYPRYLTNFLEEKLSWGIKHNSKYCGSTVYIMF